MPATTAEDIDAGDDATTDLERRHDLIARPLEAVNDAESNLLLLQDHFAILRERFRHYKLPEEDLARAVDCLRDAHLSIRKTRGHLQNAGGARR